MADVSRMFSQAAHWIAEPCRHAGVVIIAVATVMVWAATGPVFGYSDTWQLIINTGTIIITFLMVFLIQNTQNPDTAAIQLKLDELIRADQNARNAMLCLEDLTEDQLKRVKAAFTALASPRNRRRKRSGRCTKSRMSWKRPGKFWRKLRRGWPHPASAATDERLPVPR